MPKVTNRSSSKEWSGSAPVADRTSRNTVAASSNETPCLARFSAALPGSLDGFTPSGARSDRYQVVVGYGTQRKKDVTGSVASVATKDFSTLPVADAGQAVEGKAAGVQVIASGPPGNNVTFRIRGTGTINDADPLIEMLTRRQITPVIPPKANRKFPRVCDFALYCERNLVERFFNKLKQFRHIITVETREPVAFFSYPDKPSLLKSSETLVHSLVEADEDSAAAFQMLAHELGALGVTPKLQPRIVTSAPSSLAAAATAKPKTVTSPATLPARRAASGIIESMSITSSAPAANPSMVACRSPDAPSAIA